MRLLISLVFVWLLSGITQAMAGNELRTIGDMRSACMGVSNAGNTSDALDSGVCIGWVKSVSTWRNTFCELAYPAPPEATILDTFSIAVARDTADHSFGAMIQGFLN